MVNVSELKLGELYVLHLGDRTARYPGVRFVDGRSDKPVDARTAKRMRFAFGDALQIAHADSLTGSPPVVSKAQEEIAVGDFDEEDEAPVKAEFIADDDDELEDLDRAELIALCAEEKIRHHWKAGAAKLRKVIRDSRNRV